MEIRNLSIPFPLCWIRVCISMGYSVPHWSLRSRDLISISFCFTPAHCSGLNRSLYRFLKLEQWLSEVIGCDLQKEIDFIFNVKCTCVYTMKQECHKTIPLLPEMYSFNWYCWHLLPAWHCPKVPVSVWSQTKIPVIVLYILCVGAGEGAEKVVGHLQIMNVKVPGFRISHPKLYLS